jgi:hypothetical protein
MRKVARYVAAYSMWLVDLGLSAWLFVVSRTALRAFLGLFYERGVFQYKKTAELADKVFALLLGIGLLVFIRSSKLKLPERS